MEPSAANQRTGSRWSGSISSSLLERVKTQQPQAWRQLVQLFGPVVYGWCRQSGLQPADAADVAQETFSAAAAGIDKFRREKAGDSFHGWLWTITRNKIRDHFRQRKCTPVAEGGTDAQQHFSQLPDDWAGTTLSDEPPGGLGNLARRGLELVRAEFEDRTWQAFWRTTVDGQRPAEVAEELGMTRAAVYKAKSRVLRRTRQELGDLLQ